MPMTQLFADTIFFGPPSSCECVFLLNVRPVDKHPTTEQRNAQVFTRVGLEVGSCGVTALKLQGRWESSRSLCATNGRW